MPLRNRIKASDLRLQIPERKVSPRDWSIPYSRPCVTRWQSSKSWSSMRHQRHLNRFFAQVRTSSQVRVQHQEFQSERTISSLKTRTSSSGFLRFSHYRSGSNVGVSPSIDVQSHVLTPTDQLDGDPLLLARRSSSGALLSPDVLEQIKSVDGMEGGNDNFYLLKKDSQRRLTLVKVLQQDRAAICRQWNLLMSKENPDFCLSQRHFQILMDGIRGFIPDQNRIALEAAISKLKEELDFDGAKINQISIALYLFQDAVNSSLRSHSIKPHWMFALDNLVRSAVQSAVTILTPELGAHLADPEMVLDDLRAGALPDPTRDDLGVGHIPLDPVAHEPDGASTSGVSTVNSIPGGLNPMAHVNSAHPQIHQYQELSQVREENSRLLSQLLELQHKYQHLLRHNLVEQRQQLDVLSAHRSTPNSPLEEALLASSGLSSHNPEPTNRPPDEELVDWLRNLDLNDGSVQRFVNEDLTYSDVMSLMSRDDLRRLGLRAGPELRIWKAIQTQRSREIRQDQEGDSNGPDSPP